jgi:hypothetical protein
LARPRNVIKNVNKIAANHRGKVMSFLSSVVEALQRFADQRPGMALFAIFGWIALVLVLTSDVRKALRARRRFVYGPGTPGYFLYSPDGELIIAG